jgi:hypothetical protein
LIKEKTMDEEQLVQIIRKENEKLFHHIHELLEEMKYEMIDIIQKKKGKVKEEEPPVERQTLNKEELMEWLKEGLGNDSIQKIMEKSYGIRKKWGEHSKQIVHWTQKDCMQLLKEMDREERHRIMRKVEEMEKLIKKEYNRSKKTDPIV